MNEILESKTDRSKSLSNLKEQLKREASLKNGPNLSVIMTQPPLKDSKMPLENPKTFTQEEVNQLENQLRMLIDQLESENKQLK